MRLVFLFAVVAAELWADEASRRAKASEVLEVMNGRQLQDQIFDQVTQMALSQIPESSDPRVVAAAKEMTSKLMSLLQTKLSWDVVKPAYAKIYADSFTETELDGILEFYRSPAGKAMLAKMPLLVQKSMSFAQEHLKGIQPEIERLLKETVAKLGRE